MIKAAFEPNGQFYQFTQLPFGVINGVPASQQSINIIVKEETLKDRFTYLDNVIIKGETEVHDKNLEEFLKVVNKKVT